MSLSPELRVGLPCTLALASGWMNHRLAAVVETALSSLRVRASRQPALVVLATFVPFVFAARWFQRKLTSAYLVVRENIGRLLGVVAEALVGARSYAPTASKLARRRGWTRRSRRTTGAARSEPPGTVVAFLFLITLLVDPVLIASEVINEGQNAVAGWRRVLDVLEVPPDVADPEEDGEPLPSGPVDVRFDRVSCRHPRAGESARTASGKTTFAKLLTRLLDPVEGEVRLADVPVRRIRFGSLRRRVLMVPQDGPLVDGTIARPLSTAEASDGILVLRPRATGPAWYPCGPRS